MSEEKLKLIAIKTKSGFYLSDNLSHYSDTVLLERFFDGISPDKTFHKNWIKLKSIPNKIERSVRQSDINRRYELIDPTMKSAKVPSVLLHSDVIYYDNDMCEDGWKAEYGHLKSLYEFKSDAQPNIMENVPFEIEVILELDEIKEHGLFSYAIQKTQWSHDGTTEITNKNAKSQIIDAICFPDIILSSKPCKLTSRETYGIIREHIKNNINPIAAEITSDYNFCFTVKKKIPLSEPEKFTVDVNNSIFSNRKRKPKYATRYRKHRLIEIFEMTSDKDGYANYSVIPGFVGKNHTDLKEKIDFYLKSLIEFINRPIEDCPHCKGAGVRDVRDREAK